MYVEGKKVIDLWGSAEGDETYNGDSLQVFIRIALLPRKNFSLVEKIY